MAKWIVLLGHNCADAAREAEFRDWWRNVHLPDFSETRGVTRATVYEVAPPPPHSEEAKPAEEAAKPAEEEARPETAKFVGVIEIEADTVDEVWKALGDNMNKKREEGRFSELMKACSPAPHGVYMQMKSLSK